MPAEAVDSVGIDPQANLHDLLMSKGASGTAMAAGMSERVRGRRAPVDVLGGRRGQRIIKAAREHLDDKDRSADTPSVVLSAWCHASFPHKLPPADAGPWMVRTDYVTLRVESGTLTDDTGVSRVVGLPYGAYARLICIDWSSQAYNNRSRDIHLGRNLVDTMRRLGLPKGGKTWQQLLDQAERLAACHLTFNIHSKGKGRSGFINQTIVDTAVFSEAQKGGRFVERIRLSEGFFQQIMQHPVAIDPLSIKAIRNSPMAIDIYCWLAFRLLAVTADTTISWAALKAQFGTGYAAMRNFKTQFAECLLLAKGVYFGARADLSEHGITLRPSPPPAKLAHPSRCQQALL